MYHYVYRITNNKLNKHYYGKRSSRIPPNQDLGFYYFSSSRDLEFIKDQKVNREDYKYKIVRNFRTEKEAITFEILLHDKFDVAKNPSFYNLAKQTAVGFAPTAYATECSAKLRRGVPLTDTHRSNISKGRVDRSIRKKVPVHIYNYSDNSIIATNVCLTDWCKDNPTYSQGTLHQTLKADRTKPSKVGNRLHYKQIYAQYA